MSFYQQGLQSRFGLRSFLTCCYGGKAGRPASPDTVPGEQPDFATAEDLEAELQQSSAAVENQDIPDAKEEFVLRKRNSKVSNSEIEFAFGNGISASDYDDWQVYDPLNHNIESATLPRRPALDVTVRLDLSNRQVEVCIVRTFALASASAVAGGSHNWESVQVCSALLPAKKQRHRSQIAPVRDAAELDCKFSFSNVVASEVSKLSVRFRVYGCQRRRRRQLIGESVLPLSCLQSSTGAIWKRLKLLHNAGYVESEISDSVSGSTVAGSLTSLGVPTQSELLLGIAYNSRTGQLQIEVVKASCLSPSSSSKPPDAFTKVRVQSSAGRTLFKSKTRTVPNSKDPMWKESFVYAINKNQLPDVFLEVIVCARRTVARREVIGSIRIGKGSTGEAMEHWCECLDNQGQQICRWHHLFATDAKA